MCVLRAILLQTSVRSQAVVPVQQAYGVLEMSSRNLLWFPRHRLLRVPTRPNPKIRSNRMPDCSYSLTYRISRPFTRFLRPHIPTHCAVDGCNHSAPASHLTPLSRALKYRLLLSPSSAHTHNKSIPSTSFSSNIIRLLLFLLYAM